MRVILLETGKIEEFNDSYANRLVEQGKAVIAPKKAVKAESAEKPVKPEKTEKKTRAKKSGKGD